MLQLAQTASAQPMMQCEVVCTPEVHCSRPCLEGSQLITCRQGGECYEGPRRQFNLFLGGMPAPLGEALSNPVQATAVVDHGERDSVQGAPEEEEAEPSR